MVPEAMSVEEMSVDWKIMLMMSITHIVQENQTAFVPLIVPHKQDEWMMQVPQLSDLLSIKKEELPNFFVISPFSGQVIKYPDSVEDIKISPQSILMWARRTILYLEIDLWEQGIKDAAKASEEEGREMSDEENEFLEYNKSQLANANEELAIIIEKLDSIKAKLDAGENEAFAAFTSDIQDMKNENKESEKKDSEKKTEETETVQQIEL